MDRDPAAELATVWRTHEREIRAIADRTSDLGERLRARHAVPAGRGFVPCHGDIHTYNILVDAGGALRVVDWDEIVMAPRERDLMFVLGSPIGLRRGEREIALFREGYGPIDVDPERLAYYHADWALQDLVSYAREVLETSASLESRIAALRIFTSLFDPGDEVDVALQRLESGPAADHSAAGVDDRSRRTTRACGPPR